jgi:hypothetical protein
MRRRLFVNRHGSVSVVIRKVCQSFRTPLIVIPAKAGIHPTVDTGLRPYDKEEE